MDYLNGEDRRVQRAVDAAAREEDPELEDIEEAENTAIAVDSNTNRSRPTLHPDGPDLLVIIGTDPDQQRYVYRMHDASAGLSHSCVRIVPNAGQTGLAMLGAFNALRSITRNRIMNYFVSVSVSLRAFRFR